MIEENSKEVLTQMKEEQILIGRYQGSGRGFGFFIPEGAQSRNEDCFVPPRQEGGAWDGDRVEAVLAPEDPTQPGRRIARVAKVLERGNPTVTGTVRKENREVWLRPDNERLSGAIKIIGRAKVREGEKAAVAVTSYGSANAAPLGKLCATFGPSGSRAAAVEAILYQQGVEREFPDEVLSEAQAAPRSVSPAALRGRLDLRDKIVITIDGAASKDLDDAVSLERDGDNWVLGVHIADVSAYVKPGTALDEEAFRRGTSVYFADQVVPMLPVALSNGICSLNGGVDRLTLSCFMVMDKRGDIVDHSVAKSVIRSTERMTYEDCNILLAEEGHGQAPHPGDKSRREQYGFLSERYAHILPMLRDMAELAKRLEKRKKKRGSLELETRESYIVCDSMGRPVDIVAREQGQSEKLIEEFMLAANETVARHLFEHRCPAVYRVHEKPSQDKTDTLRAMLSPLGYSILQADHGSLQRVLETAKGKPEASAVSMMVLRSMMKAKYSTENLGHFGIAADYYCHFTSPIRRYPDLMVHRSLHSLLEETEGRRAESPRPAKLEKACEKAAVQSSQRELAAQTAERDIDKLYFADYMHEHIGEEFPGVVSGVTRFGVFAALPNGVEGLIPVETLPEDRYEYDDLRMSLTGERTGVQYTFGMELTVICVAADPSTGRVDFRLPGQEEVPAKERERHPEERRGRSGGGSSHGRSGVGGKGPGKRRSTRPAMHVPKRGKRGKKR